MLRVQQFQFGQINAAFGIHAFEGVGIYTPYVAFPD